MAFVPGMKDLQQTGARGVVHHTLCGVHLSIFSCLLSSRVGSAYKCPKCAPVSPFLYPIQKVRTGRVHPELQAHFFLGGPAMGLLEDWINLLSSGWIIVSRYSKDVLGRLALLSPFVHGTKGVHISKPTIC
jgi:hypothetical protein